jgi:hypothetical protein
LEGSVFTSLHKIPASPGSVLPCLNFAYIHGVPVLYRLLSAAFAPLRKIMALETGCSSILAF